MNTRNILVIGGAGFIGSNLIDQLLVLGNKVLCFDNFDPFYDKNVKLENLAYAHKHQNFVLIEGDIRNQSDLEKCFSLHPIDLIIHLAAKAGVRPSIEDPKNYYEVNVSGTLNILEVMRIYGVKKMLFASSSSVYGNNQKVPFYESDNVDYPISPYAASKKCAELLCYVYHHLYGFDIFCLRLFTVYGPRQRPDLAIHKFTKAIFNGEPIKIYGDGSAQRDFTFIDDIVDGIMAAITNVSGYEIINIGDSKPVSVKTLIEKIEMISGLKALVEFENKQPGDVEITYANIDKANRLLGYQPKIDLEKGLEIFINYQKKTV